MLSFFISENDNEDYYCIFLSEIKKEIGKTYDAFVIGLPKSHFAVKIFNNTANIHFDTVFCSLTFPKDDDGSKKYILKDIYPECALL